MSVAIAYLEWWLGSVWFGHLGRRPLCLCARCAGSQGPPRVVARARRRAVLQLEYVPARCGVLGNELADALAKCA